MGKTEEQKCAFALNNYVVPILPCREPEELAEFH